MTAGLEAARGVFTADLVHSSFEAEVTHFEICSFRTRFSETSARLELGDGVARLHGEAKVESISIQSPPPFRQNVVFGEDFFDAARYPVIAFTADKLSFLDGGELEVDGSLTIKDVTRPVEVRGSYRGPIEDRFGSTRIGLDLSATIDRRDFGISYQAPLPGGGKSVGWEVLIDINLELIQAKEA